VQSPARGSKIASVHAVFRGFFVVDFRFRPMRTSDCDCANRRFIRMNAAFPLVGSRSQADTYVDTLFSLQLILESGRGGILEQAALRSAGADECVRPYVICYESRLVYSR
jgi:hypothetical protein